MYEKRIFRKKKIHRLGRRVNGTQNTKRLHYINRGRIVFKERSSDEREDSIMDSGREWRRKKMPFDTFVDYAACQQ